MNYRFSKEERLCSKRLIDNLFHNGSSFIMYPYRVVILATPITSPIEEASVQVLTSVPKRRFKRAVDRNYLKRRIRESYRLQKSKLYPFLQEHSLNLSVAFQYVGKERLDFHYMYERMGELLLKIANELTEKHMGKGD